MLLRELNNLSHISQNSNKNYISFVTIFTLWIVQTILLARTTARILMNLTCSRPQSPAVASYGPILAPVEAFCLSCRGNSRCDVWQIGNTSRLLRTIQQKNKFVSNKINFSCQLGPLIPTSTIFVLHEVLKKR